MRKSIKIEESVYDRLYDVRGKGETFSECIDRLLSIVETVREVARTLGPSHHLMSDRYVSQIVPRDGDGL